jgi:hypothetical protein
MTSAHGTDALALWEAGAGRGPVERPLALLAAAEPRQSWDELAALPIGRRDAALLTVRERLFGRSMPGTAACPACGELLEFELDARELRDGAATAGDERDEIQVDGQLYPFRLPNSTDLAAVAVCTDLEAARSLLARRCLVAESEKGPIATGEPLPGEVVAALAARLAERDPLAHLELDLECPACGHGWYTRFDIADFLWTEVGAEAQRLLRDVDTLARAYGWAEADILGMSAARRQAYLELVG